MGRRGLPVVGIAVLAAAGLALGLALRGGDGDSDAAGDAAGGGAPTTTAHVHAPGEDGMTEAMVPALTCAPDFGAGGSAGTVPSGPLPPGAATAEGPPVATCLETGTGCVVSFSMRWSDGYVEGASRAADAPGTYTLTGERGAEATFAVDATDTCTSPTITYQPTWPASPR